MIRPADKDVNLSLGVLEEYFQALADEPGDTPKDVLDAFNILQAEVEFLRAERAPLQTIHLVSGDAMVLTCEPALSCDARERLKAHVEQFLEKMNLKGGCPVLVLDRGIRLSVLANGSSYTCEDLERSFVHTNPRPLTNPPAPLKPEPPPLRFRREDGKERA